MALRPVGHLVNTPLQAGYRVLLVAARYGGGKGGGGEPGVDFEWSG